MGAYSTASRHGSPRAAEETVSATVRQMASIPAARTLSTMLLRISAWAIFVGGGAAAVLGIAGLHVEITVAGLILACTSGLVLLKLRASTDDTD